jgi:hypothetical protein
MAGPLTVILIDVEPGTGRHVFYARPPVGGEDERGDGPPPRGLRARVEARLRRLRSLWQHSSGRAARLSRAAWEWLQRRTHPDESLLARLRSAETVDLHHPASMSAEEASAAWSAFLARSRRRHWPWFVFDLLAAPGAAVLAVLPGPNIIGYWFFYRAVHHALILHGLGNARSGRLATRLRPGAAHPAALDCDPEAVDDFLRRHGVPVRREERVAGRGEG